MYFFLPSSIKDYLVIWRLRSVTQITVKRPVFVDGDGAAPRDFLLPLGVWASGGGGEERGLVEGERVKGREGEGGVGGKAEGRGWQE